MVQTVKEENHMDWRAAFNREHQPQPAEMEAFINSPFWQTLCNYIEDTYQIQPQYAYSTCSMQEGWSIRYRKGVRAICSMYPMEGYFMCMVSIGRKELADAEELIKGCSQYTQRLFEKTDLFNGGKLLLAKVQDENVLEDVKKLIALRCRGKKKKA